MADQTEHLVGEQEPTERLTAQDEQFPTDDEQTNHREPDYKGSVETVGFDLETALDAITED